MANPLITEINKIKVCEKSGRPALHKPLLLLMVLADIYNQNHGNRFVFNDYAGRLVSLLRQFGWMKTKRYQPELPFYHMGSSSFWKLENPEKYLNPSKGPSAPLMLKLKAAASLDSGVYQDLTAHKEQIPEIIRFILNKYWSSTIHGDILNQIGVAMPAEEGPAVRPVKRDPEFMENVLRVYDRSCAICGMSCRFGDDLLGLDAAHVKAIQYGGPDIVRNGLALCKLHHWAFDRGAMGISAEYRVLVSQQLNGVLVDKFFRAFNRQELRRPLKEEYAVDEEFSRWHREEIFRGPVL